MGLRDMVSENGGNVLMVRLGDLSGLSQPYSFYEQTKEIFLNYTLTKILKSKKKPTQSFLSL